MVTPSDPTSPVPVAPPSPTAAFVIHLVLAIVAATLSSLIAAGVFPGDSTTGKIAVIIAAQLAAFGYGAKTTARATIAYKTLARSAGKLVVLGTVLAFAAMINVAAASLAACGAAQKPAGAFGTCSVDALSTDVGNGTLAQAVEQALLQDDYVGAIATLIGKLGAQEVKCAIVAIEALEAPTAGSGSGAAPRIEVTDKDAKLAERARDIAKRNGW